MSVLSQQTHYLNAAKVLFELWLLTIPQIDISLEETYIL